MIARLALVAASIIALVGGLAGGTASADAPPADPRPRLVILTIETSAEDLARSFERDLEAQLETMRVPFLARARLRAQMRKSTKWTEGCVVGACLTEIRAQTGAGVALLAALTGSGTTFGYVITLVRTDTGRVLDQEAERCDVCTESEAMGSAVLAAVKLVNALPDRLPDEAAEQGAAVEVAVHATERRHAAERQGTRRAGWALTLIGLAAATAGTVLYLTDGDRPAYGLAAAGGGGLAVGGITVLVF